MHRRRLAVVLMLIPVFLTPIQAQQKTLRRMPAEELKVFTHDLLHDLTLWDLKVRQVASHLDVKYKQDDLAKQTIDLTRLKIASVREDVTQMAEHETIRGNVVLLHDLDSMGSEFYGLQSALVASPGLPEGFASTDMVSYSLAWQESMLVTTKEINSYRERFYAHLLATAEIADLTLPSRWLDRFK